MMRSKCPDCGAKLNSRHLEGCDVARCLVTGQQRLQCEGEPWLTNNEDDWHDECGHDRWKGHWSGELECEQWGWWAISNPNGLGWSPVPAGTPGAVHDLNRLFTDARWDKNTARWIQK